jgi:hypothetical protein
MIFTLENCELSKNLTAKPKKSQIKKNSHLDVLIKNSDQKQNHFNNNDLIKTSKCEFFDLLTTTPKIYNIMITNKYELKIMDLDNKIINIFDRHSIINNQLDTVL